MLRTAVTCGAVLMAQLHATTTAEVVVCFCELPARFGALKQAHWRTKGIESSQAHSYPQPCPARVPCRARAPCSAVGETVPSWRASPPVS